MLIYNIKYKCSFYDFYLVQYYRFRVNVLASRLIENPTLKFKINNNPFYILMIAILNLNNNWFCCIKANFSGLIGSLFMTGKHL